MIFEGTPARDPLDIRSIASSAFNVSLWGALAITRPCYACKRELDFTIVTLLNRVAADIECPWCSAPAVRFKPGAVYA